MVHLYATNVNEIGPNENLTDYIRNVTKQVEEKQQKGLCREWQDKFHYAKLVQQEYENIKFPALRNYRLGNWQGKIIRQAAEEQLYKLRGIGPSSGSNQ